MKLIDQYFTILNPVMRDDWIRMMKTIERAYRTCYRNEGSITEDSYKTYLPKHRNHQASAEHGAISVLIVTSRALQQEITRHRLASYSIESTRWCDYKSKGDLLYIRPSDWNTMTTPQQKSFIESCQSSEDFYLKLRLEGLKPQRARDSISLAYASEIVMTANPREWRTIFNLRCAPDAHPDIQDLMKKILREFISEADPLFGDLRNLL
jgi:thymidylate synthase (FAD)